MKVKVTLPRNITSETEVVRTVKLSDGSTILQLVRSLGVRPDEVAAVGGHLLEARRGHGVGAAQALPGEVNALRFHLGERPDSNGQKAQELLLRITGCTFSNV